MTAQRGFSYFLLPSIFRQGPLKASSSGGGHRQNDSLGRRLDGAALGPYRYVPPSLLSREDGPHAAKRGRNVGNQDIRGKLTTGRFELKRDIMSRWHIFFERISRSKKVLDRWSLFRIPPEYQTTFRILLLVPLGALLIALLRNIVGFQTFGIFMPLLMALAFRNTGLFYGLAMFAGIIFIGYAARRYLNSCAFCSYPECRCSLRSLYSVS